MPDAATFQRFDTLANYHIALQALIAGAQKRLWFFEHTLQDCALDSRIQHDLLVQFLTTSGTTSVRILVIDPAYLLSHCPRLLLLHKQFSHRLEIRTPADLPPSWQQDYVLADEDHDLKRYHFDWMRGESGIDRRESAGLTQIFNLIWGNASPPEGLHQMLL